MSSDYEALVALGYVHRYEFSFPDVAGSAAVYVGLTTGDREVIALGRAYSSSGSVMRIELFEDVSWSGGSDARHLNRRFSSDRPKPVVLKAGVTPGVLGAVKTGITLRASTSTGAASLQVAPDDSPLFLQANTSYVVRLTNDHGGTATLSGAFDLREIVGGSTNELDG